MATMSSIYLDETLDPLLLKFSEYDTFSFDTETSGLNPIDSRLLLAQITFPDETFVINARLDLRPLMPFFASKDWLKIMQNAKFDTKFVLHNFNTKTSNIYDTMLAEQMIRLEEHASSRLDILAKKYLNVDLNKDTRNSFINATSHVFTQEQLDYAADDTKVLFGIREQQLKIIEEQGLQKVAELEFELAPVVAAMELAGVPINREKWQMKLEDYKKQHIASKLRMHELLFDNSNLSEQLGMFERDAINLNSPQQIKKAFTALGVDMEATNERELKRINHPAAIELLNYRGLQKIMTSYGTSFLDKIHPFDQRIHPDYQQIGTATGRFSCKEPNLQQVPEDFRKCVGLKDYKIVAADFANIELRILAEYSEDPNFIKAFSSGDDPHKSTASIMFNIPIASVTKEQRFTAKTINFGISYGMGTYKLMDMLNERREPKDKLTYTKVAAIMNRYKATYEKANKWLSDAGNLAYRRGFSETMLGRRRWYSKPEQGADWEKQIAHIKRQGANSPVQGTNADITKLAMLNLYHDLKTYGYRADIILQVHDEIGVLAHKSQAEDVKLIVEDSMIKSAQELLKLVPVKVDTYVNDVWEKG